MNRPSKIHEQMPMSNVGTERLVKAPAMIPLSFAYVAPAASVAVGLLGFPVVVFAFVMEVAAFFATVYLHRRPDLRRWKYEAIATMTWAFGLEALLQADKAIAGQLFLAWLIAPMLATAMTLPIHRLLFAPGANQGTLVNRSRHAFRATHTAFTTVGSLIAGVGLLYFGWSGKIAGLLLLLFALIAFVLIRYAAGESLARFPIIYLRAFSSKDVVRTFTRIVAPALSKLHVLVGLTLRRERKLLVKARFGPSAASLYVVPDDVWKSWVQSELRRSYAVLLDYSVPTENLDWELAEALRLNDASRVAILVGPTPVNNVPGTVRQIAIGDSIADRRKSRKELELWIRGLVDPAQTAAIA